MELQLASMENVTCWAFRKLCLGATDAYTGIFSMNYLTNRHKAWKEIDTFPIMQQRQWIQVATSKESECKEFVGVMNKELNDDPEKDSAYGVQLNLSCPSPMIIKLGQGPALIKRSLKVVGLLKELLKQDRLKVSIKTRLGLNYRDIENEKIIKLFEELEKIDNPNFTQVVVHFKHASEPSFTGYDYSFLPRLAEFNIPIVINGGIKNYNDFLKITKNLHQKKRNNVVGFMIGREALKNPDCFIESSKILNGKEFKPRTKEEIKAEFQKNCTIHEPREIYLKKIPELCAWAK